MDEFHVLVDFGSGFDAQTQASALMMLERGLREQGVAAEVFKRTMKDDSKLRVRMTLEERAKL